MKGAHTHTVALLPGDGTGPEVVAAACTVLDAAQERFGFHLEMAEHNCGAQYYKTSGREWADGAFDATRAADAIFLGAIGWPGVALPDGNIAGAGVVFGLRFGLDLFANVRPAKMFRGVRHNVHGRFTTVWDADKVDLVIVRENTEGLYAPVRGAVTRGGRTDVAVDTNIITHRGCERVIRFAYELATKRGGAPSDRKHRLTCIDKANVLAGSRLFRSVFDEMGREYPQIEKDHAYADAFTQWLIRKPEFYDVCVTTNMLGDIVTDLAAVLQGGMGMAPAANIGDKHAMFEPVHGSSPTHAGKNEVNPMAAILAASMMVDWLGEKKGDTHATEAARAIDAAVAAVVSGGKTLTYDLGGSATTSAVAEAVAKQLA